MEVSALIDAPRNEHVTLTLVCPVYNEEESVELFLRRVHAVFDACPQVALDMVFVNDGSTDATLERLLALQKHEPRLRVVDLTRNFGKEAALSAGLRVAEGRVVAPIDVDLQDPPELLLEMLEKWRQGYDMVVGRRIRRDTDSWLKRTSALCFYRVHNALADSRLPENVGDFRLMDRRVVDVLNALPESRRFMKGLFAWVGFRTATVDYARPQRAAGQGKFNGWRLWNFALEGITSFSTVPLRVWTYVGGFVALLAFLYAVKLIVQVWMFGVDVPGYASTLVTVTLLGGLQLVGIGVIGEYLGRAYLESKRRPVYLVRRVYAPQGPQPPAFLRPIRSRPTRSRPARPRAPRSLHPGKQQAGRQQHKDQRRQPVDAQLPARGVVEPQ